MPYALVGLTADTTTERVLVALLGPGRPDLPPGIARALHAIGRDHAAAQA